MQIQQMRKKTIENRTGIINVLLLCCGFICLICYDKFGGLWLKGFTSSWFVILGIVNVIYGWKNGMRRACYGYLIVIGLILGMCADVLLGVWFIFGILSFAMGHVMYLIAFILQEKINRKDFIFILPISALSIYVVIGTPYIRVQDPMLEKMLVGYAVIISCMFGKAISNFRKEKCISRGLVLLGCAMFWFSDMMLAVDMFGESSRFTWILCSYNYWPGQLILAHSLYHYINERLQNKGVSK